MQNGGGRVAGAWRFLMRFMVLAAVAMLSLGAPGALGSAFAEEPAAPQTPAGAAQSAPSDDAAVRLDLARRIVALRSQASEMQLFRAKLPWYTQAMRANVRLTHEQRVVLPTILEQQFRAAMVPAHEDIAATYARMFTADQLRRSCWRSTPAPPGGLGSPTRMKSPKCRSTCSASSTSPCFQGRRRRCKGPAPPSNKRRQTANKKGPRFRAALHSSSALAR